MSASADGLVLATTSNDSSLKIYDVINFGKMVNSIENLFSLCDIYSYFIFILKITTCIYSDMINMMRLPFVPNICEWTHPPGAAITLIAVYVFTITQVPAPLYYHLSIAQYENQYMLK